MFNGEGGQGSRNSSGEVTYFDFKVEQFHIDSRSGVTTGQLANTGKLYGIETLNEPTTDTQLYGISENGTLIAPKMFLTGGRTYLHEIYHQFLRRTESHEHNTGGAGKVPPEALTPKNVDAILQDAFWDLQPIRYRN
jgi:hypothetical protein